MYTLVWIENSLGSISLHSVQEYVSGDVDRKLQTVPVSSANGL